MSTDTRRTDTAATRPGQVVVFSNAGARRSAAPEEDGRRKAVEGEPDDPTLTQTAREADATLAVQTRQSFSNT